MYSYTHSARKVWVRKFMSSLKLLFQTASLNSNCRSVSASTSELAILGSLYPPHRSSLGSDSSPPTADM